MLKTTPEQNNALVLEAFDTLFSKREHEAAGRFRSPMALVEIRAAGCQLCGHQIFHKNARVQ